jgi:hypothetical protein
MKKLLTILVFQLFAFISVAQFGAQTQTITGIGEPGFIPVFTPSDARITYEIIPSPLWMNDNYQIGYNTTNIQYDFDINGSFRADSILLKSNSLIFPSGQTQGYVLHVNTDGTTYWAASSGGGTSSSTWIDVPTSGYSYTTNRISIGSSNTFTDYKLFVNGKLKIIDELNFDYFGTSRIKYGKSNGGSLEFYSNNNTGLKGYSAMILDERGDVTISNKLFLTNGANDGFVLKSSNDGRASWASPTSLGMWNVSNNDYYYSSGNVGIGMAPTGGYALQVNGMASVDKLVIELQGAWPDYVFNEDYNLLTLEETEDFINENGHLPNTPAADKVQEEGIDVGVMNALLLQKVEELTLHLIDQQKQIKELKSQIQEQNSNK